MPYKRIHREGKQHRHKISKEQITDPEQLEFLIDKMDSNIRKHLARGFGSASRRIVTHRRHKKKEITQIFESEDSFLRFLTSEEYNSEDWLEDIESIEIGDAIIQRKVFSGFRDSDIYEIE